MLVQDLQPYQTWRLTELERLRRASSMQPTTLPVVYVLGSSQGVTCASVPASLDAQHADLLSSWWEGHVLAKCQVAQWLGGALTYYAGCLAPGVFERFERARHAHQDVDDVLAALHLELASMPLLLLVDVVTHWQQSWLRQDPSMQRWGQGGWRAREVPALLWRYVRQRLAAESPTFGQSLGQA